MERSMRREGEGDGGSGRTWRNNKSSERPSSDRVIKAMRMIAVSVVYGSYLVNIYRGRNTVAVALPVDSSPPRYRPQTRLGPEVPWLKKGWKSLEFGDNIWRARLARQSSPRHINSLDVILLLICKSIPNCCLAISLAQIACPFSRTI